MEKKWKLEKFWDYFEQQQVNSTFNNWQMQSAPVGFATTNNLIEQYNSIIKKLIYNYLFHY